MPWQWGATGWSALGPALAGAGAIAIVVVYLLRRQPQERVVPSTLLWERAVRETLARRPWQRFRQRLPFWLEFGAALALAAALARPLAPVAGGTLTGAVWVIDAGGSMAAGDRWAQAVEALARGLEHAGPGFGGALIVAGAEAHLAAAPGSDASGLRHALAGLQDRGPDGAAPDWPAALALAAGARTQLPAGSRIHLITDGADPRLADFLARRPDLAAHVVWVPVGEGIDNTSLLTAAFGQDGTLLATVAHAGRRPAAVRLLLEEGGRAVSAREITVAPGELGQVTWEGLDPAGTYRLVLTPGDAYALDDEVWVVPHRQDRIRIALLSEGPADLIERALRLHPAAEVVRASAAGGWDPDAAYDLTVVAGAPLPAGLPAEMPVIWIDPPSPGDAFAPARLEPGSGQDGSRLLEHVDLDGFRLLRAVPLAADPEEVPLLLGDGRVIATYRPPQPGQGGRLILGFDPYQGDLLLRPAWPILIQNALSALAPGGFGLPDRPVAGQVLTLAPSPLFSAVTVTAPGGTVVTPGERLRQPGLYRASARGPSGEAVTAHFWVRPDAGESRQVSQEAALAHLPLAAGTAPETEPGGDGASRELAEAWRFPALLALILVLVDTWVVRHAL